MQINDKLILKKKHPCGGYVWTIIGMGADVRLKCDTCGRIVMIPRDQINKMVKSEVKKEDGKNK